MVRLQQRNQQNDSAAAGILCLLLFLVKLPDFPILMIRFKALKTYVLNLFTINNGVQQQNAVFSAKVSTVLTAREISVVVFFSPFLLV